LKNAQHRKETITKVCEELSVAWWKRFDDPMLTQLIDDAVTNNHDLKAAKARICEARAAKKSANSNLLPDISLSGTYQRYKFSDNGIIPIEPLEQTGLIDTNHNFYDIGFDASWEIDIFGGKRAKARAAGQRVCQSIEMYRDVIITLIADVAKNYMVLRGEQNVREILEQRLSFQQNIVDDLRVKNRSGLLSEIEVSRVVTAENELKGEISAADGKVKAAIYRIGVLTGNHPAALEKQLGDSVALPQSPDFNLEIVSADIIGQRPDMRALQQGVGAQSSEVSAAKAAMFPSLYMSALYRFQSLNLSDLFKSGSQWWFFGPLVNWKIFERYQLQANLDFTKAQQERVAEQFKQGILLALEDIESSYTFYHTSKERFMHQKAAASSSQNTVELTGKLLDLGLKSHLEVLKSKQEHTIQEEKFIRVHVDHNIQSIRLYKALGGGWQ